MAGCTAHARNCHISTSALKSDVTIVLILDPDFLYKMLSYRRETALQGTLVLAESGRLELRDNILLIL